MGFKVRGYTREVPQEKVRDYSLFAIATEGTEREPDYFRLFDGIDRIKVDMASRLESRRLYAKVAADEGLSVGTSTLRTHGQSSLREIRSLAAQY